MHWSPSLTGRLLTSASDWHLVLEDDRFELVVDKKPMRGSILHLEQMAIVPGMLWSRLVLPSLNGQSHALEGLPNAQARELRSEIDASIAKVRRRQRVRELIQAFPAVSEQLVQWARNTLEGMKARLQARGWLASEFLRRLVEAKPNGFEDWTDDPDIQSHIETQPNEVRQAFNLYRLDFLAWAEGLNAQHQTKRLQEDHAFFERIEKSPLTDEQRQAVTCFDTRVLLVASAGSGKTSTMVAKAGYALQRGYFSPERILMLAFNNDAAAELRQRLRERLATNNLPAEQVTAKTFHAFGLDVIGQATGKRPTVAPWIESGQDLEALLSIVDELKNQDLVFRTRWDLFRIVLGQDLPEFGKESESPESWSKETGQQGFWTCNNEVVKSRGEQLLANWLFYNGVRYEYEKAYEHDTADAAYRQYRPDFFLTDANAYLEHWALDERGEPPSAFIDYKEGMAWKRALHLQHGTRLLETTMAELWSGKAFDKLANELQQLGLTLDPNPERPAPGRQPIENPRLARNLRMFLTHVKNNRLSMDALWHRLQTGSTGRFRFRHRMFLDLFEPIHQAWEKKLRDSGFIDFEDMLNLAADHLEQGNWLSPYELVMVDEFQDASHTRARLVKALTNKPDTCLFAVGDDWQSINRFAGADLGVMTRFSDLFGPARTLRLETTFRCPQSLCDISSQFIQKNPAQLRKAVRSIKSDVSEPVQIVKVDDERQIGAAVLAQLEAIGKDAAATGQRQKVYVLGRYRKDRSYLPQSFFHPSLSVEFLTAHSSKGLECDHVIVPRMTSETMGFPSRIEDDPVMSLAMPNSDGFEFSEERRLFYVALTRAKSSVRLITLTKRESPFVVELIKAHNMPVSDLSGKARSEELCPECGKGFLTAKKGKYGPFHGCSSFPTCRYTRKADRPGSLHQASAPGRR